MCNSYLERGMIIVKNVASVMSMGTESMVTDFGNKNIIQKAKANQIW